METPFFLLRNYSFSLLDGVFSVDSLALGFELVPPANPRHIDHQATGESGLTSSLFLPAIQKPHPRLKEKKNKIKSANDIF